MSNRRVALRAWAAQTRTLPMPSSFTSSAQLRIPLVVVRRVVAGRVAQNLGQRSGSFAQGLCLCPAEGVVVRAGVEAAMSHIFPPILLPIFQQRLLRL